MMVSPWAGWLVCLVSFHHLSSSFAFQRPFHASTVSSQRYSGLQDTTMPTDLILSSGFCAFARQSGVLAALEDFNISIDRCVGTSSGSLAASLYCTGQFTPTQIADELSSRRPISLCTPALRLNRGKKYSRVSNLHLWLVITLPPKLVPFLSFISFLTLPYIPFVTFPTFPSLPFLLLPILLRSVFSARVDNSFAYIAAQRLQSTTSQTCSRSVQPTLSIQPLNQYTLSIIPPQIYSQHVLPRT